MSDKKKILVVDDEAPIRELARRHFERAGYDLMAAPNGTEGLEALSVYAPDFLITDLNYKTPAMDGVGFAREARRLGYKGPIALMASEASHLGRQYSDSEELFTGGYFDKPPKFAEIIASVGEYLQKQP